MWWMWLSGFNVAMGLSMISSDLLRKSRVKWGSVVVLVSGLPIMLIEIFGGGW